MRTMYNRERSIDHRIETGLNTSKAKKLGVINNTTKVLHEVEGTPANLHEEVLNLIVDGHIQ